MLALILTLLHVVDLSLFFFFGGGGIRRLFIYKGGRPKLGMKALRPYTTQPGKTQVRKPNPN